MMKSMIAMICITVIGVAKMVIDGDGTVLISCVTAIAALAGVEVGREVQKKQE